MTVGLFTNSSGSVGAPALLAPRPSPAVSITPDHVTYFPHFSGLNSFPRFVEDRISRDGVDGWCHTTIIVCSLLTLSVTHSVFSITLSLSFDIVFSGRNMLYYVYDDYNFVDFDSLK